MIDNAALRGCILLKLINRTKTYSSFVLIAAGEKHKWNRQWPKHNTHYTPEHRIPSPLTGNKVTENATDDDG